MAEGKPEKQDPKLQRKYTWLWVLWLALFAVIEFFALKSPKKGDTLSEHVWKWFNVRDGGTASKIGKGLIVAGVGWLGLHFLDFI